MADGRIRIVSKEGNTFGIWRVVLEDETTGVQYLFVESGYAGGLTMLMNADGTPCLSGKAGDLKAGK